MYARQSVKGAVWCRVYDIGRKMGERYIDRIKAFYE